MRICIIGISIPPVLGGLEVHTWELARHLVKAGHSVELIAWQPPSSNAMPRESTTDGVRIHRLRDCRYRYYWWPAFRLASELHSKESFDVLHSHTSFPAGLAGALLRIWKRVPLVITSHGSEIRRPMDGPLFSVLRYLLVKFSFRLADAVIGASRELSALSIQFGADPDSTFYRANATDTEKFHPGIDGAPTRSRYAIDPESVVVLFMGHFEVVKGVHIFLRAARKLLDRYPKMKFLAVGAGKEEDNISRLADELGLRDSFIFSGAVDNDEMPAHIAAADIAVFPSLAEATSIACLEAMACGCPVVVSNVGGLPEIVEHAKTGLIVDFPVSSSSGYDGSEVPEETVSALAAAVGRFVEDEAFRKEAGRHAAAKVQSEFAWEKYITEIVRTYERAAGKL